ncbi:MAG TPA: MarR family transcriptional regulator, partial [Armatimonadota bacterium]|nr:MarR family transcriptional regulator [Armatimonadota bacterium]
KLTGLFSDIVVKSLTVQLLRELEDLDVSLSQLQALTHVAERGKCSVGSIADGLGVTHPAAVKLVDKLVVKGLVTRGVAAADHRQSEIAVTAEGRRLINEVRRERTERLVRVLDRMTPEDRHALISGLQAFVTAALRDEGALDQLCVSCQALLPTNCDDFRLISGGAIRLETEPAGSPR